MRWLSPLAQVNWQAAVQQGKRFFSGTVAVDEKWIKIAGVWWYLFVAVDHVSGLPLHVALLPSNAKPYCMLFLFQLKALGYRPKVIITDGWDAYVKAIAHVFPDAEHLLCRFHALRAAFRRLRKHLPSGKARRPWANKLKGLFRTPSKRTVRRRLSKLEGEAHNGPAQAVVARLLAKLPQLLPAVGSTWRPTTSNAAERFLGAFDRFYRLKGRFKAWLQPKNTWRFLCWAMSSRHFLPRRLPSAKAAAPCKWRAMRSGRFRCFICSIDPIPHDCARLLPQVTTWRHEPPHPKPLLCAMALVATL